MTFVLDNSVAMRRCFESAAHPYADSILQILATGDDAIVPVLWFYEASAVLARAQNRGTLAYLELALRRSLPLATLDDDLIRASKAAGIAIVTQSV